MSKKHSEQKVVQGLGCLSTLGAELAALKSKRALLVTGQKSFELCGAKDIVETVLEAEQYVRFSDFSINPKLSDGVIGAKFAKDAGIDCIVSIGGGSALDMAKIIKALLTTKGNAEEIARGQTPVSKSELPLIAVPTTAGSGSETTHFAVVYIGKEKLSLASPYLQPDLALLDGNLLLSTSPYQRAVNALDAMAQAIESFWAVNGTDESRGYARKAITLLVEGLNGLLDAEDPIFLQKIMVAAHFAGKAINISKTTAPHAFSYALTSDYDIPHGHAVWMTLPAIFDLHLKKCKGESRQKLLELCALLGIDEQDDSEEKLKDFMRALGVEPEMERLGVDTVQKRRDASKRVNAERLSNNPLPLTERDIERVFKLR